MILVMKMKAHTVVGNEETTLCLVTSDPSSNCGEGQQGENKSAKIIDGTRQKKRRAEVIGSYIMYEHSYRTQ